MSNGADWISRQLAARRSGPPPTGPAGTVYSVRAPSYPPSAQPASVTPNMPTGYPPPNAQHSGRVVTSEDLSSPEALYALAQQTAQDNQRTDRCPECRKSALFTIDRDENGRPLSRVVQRCLNCNWPFSQSGSIHGHLAGARSVGQVRPARQLQNHAVEVVGGPGQGRLVYAPQPVDGQNYV